MSLESTSAEAPSPAGAKNASSERIEGAKLKKFCMKEAGRSTVLGIPELASRLSIPA